MTLPTWPTVKNATKQPGISASDVRSGVFEAGASPWPYHAREEVVSVLKNAEQYRGDGSPYYTGGGGREIEQIEVPVQDPDNSIGLSSRTVTINVDVSESLPSTYSIDDGFSSGVNDTGSNDSSNTSETTNNNESDMTRPWEESQVDGGMEELANDEHYNDDGTLDLGSGTEGGEYNVGESGHTFSDEEVAADDDIQRTGTDTVVDTSPPPVQDTSNSNSDNNSDSSDQTMLLVAGAVGVAAIYFITEGRN